MSVAGWQEVEVNILAGLASRAAHYITSINVIVLLESSHSENIPSYPSFLTTQRQAVNHL
jgi:hypothetical protein